MQLNYLFPNKYKGIGWFILIPSALLGLISLLFEYEPAFLDLKVPALFVEGFFEDAPFFFRMTENNILNEVAGVFTIIGLILVAFSKEKQEDEFIAKIRLESLVWATYINYAILFLSFLFVFDLSFLWVMIFNMFTVLIIFIIRFNWQVSRLKKTLRYEESY